jgi:hypothetical protein
LATRLRCDVARNDNCLSTCFLHPLGGIGCVLVFVKIGDQDVSALSGECDCDGFANTRVRAGDQSDLALQLSIAAIRFLAVIRERLHVAGLTGWVLMLLGIRRGGATLFLGHDLPPVE